MQAMRDPDMQPAGHVAQLRTGADREDIASTGLELPAHFMTGTGFAYLTHGLNKSWLFSRNVWMDYPWIAKASTDAGCGAAPGVQSSMRNQPRYDARYLVATPLKRRIQPRKRLT